VKIIDRSQHDKEMIIEVVALKQKQPMVVETGQEFTYYSYYARMNKDTKIILGRIMSDTGELFSIGLIFPDEKYIIVFNIRGNRRLLKVKN
jgi:hypothetical protein